MEREGESRAMKPYVDTTLYDDDLKVFRDKGGESKALFKERKGEEKGKEGREREREKSSVET